MGCVHRLGVVAQQGRIIQLDDRGVNLSEQRDVCSTSWSKVGIIHKSGAGGIRTLGTVSRTQHFQCCLFNHSSTAPAPNPLSNESDPDGQVHWQRYRMPPRAWRQLPIPSGSRFGRAPYLKKQNVPILPYRRPGITSPSGSKGIARCSRSCSTLVVSMPSAVYSVAATSQGVTGEVVG